MILIRKSIIGILLCCSLLVLIPYAPAFSLGSVTVNPSGSLYPGTPVNISYTVYVASGVAFSSYDDLQFTTELDDPRWTYAIAVNGVKNTRPVTGDRTITINGFELAYRNQDEVIVYVTLQGNIPGVFAIGANRTLVKIQELDARGYSIPTSVVSVDRLIGDPTPTPTPAYGSISVASSPAGANIYIDNVYKGLSPATFPAVPNGDHVVLVRLDGYRDFSRTLTVSGDTRDIHASLDAASAPSATASAQGTTGSGTRLPGTPAQGPGYGSLSITTSPPGALVYVDGAMMGVTPASIPMLAEGSHTVTLVMDGYQDLRTNITVNAGTTSEFITGLSKTPKTPGFGPALVFLSAGLVVLFRKKSM